MHSPPRLDNLHRITEIYFQAKARFMALHILYVPGSAFQILKSLTRYNSKGLTDFHLAAKASLPPALTVLYVPSSLDRGTILGDTRYSRLPASSYIIDAVFPATGVARP